MNLLMAIAVFAAIAPYIAFFDEPAIVIPFVSLFPNLLQTELEPPPALMVAVRPGPDRLPLTLAAIFKDDVEHFGYITPIDIINALDVDVLGSLGINAPLVGHLFDVFHEHDIVVFVDDGELVVTVFDFPNAFAAVQRFSDASQPLAAEILVGHSDGRLDRPNTQQAKQYARIHDIYPFLTEPSDKKHD